MRNASLASLWILGMFLAVPSDAVALNANQADVVAGIDAGIGRVARHIDGFDVSNIQTDEIEQIILNAFATYQEEEADWNPRAVSLASEIITIGVLSRRHYGEEKIEAEEVASSFIGPLSWILNSWRHGGPR